MNNKPREEAIHLAAQCWCDEETSSIKMDHRLAMAFAKRADALMVELEFTKQYLNPADTSFRTMVDDFMSLPDDKKNKLIDLCAALARLGLSHE